MSFVILLIFFVIISAYHLWHTFFGFGMEVFSPEYFSIGKDILRLVLVLFLLAQGSKQQLNQFFRDWKRILLAFVCLVARSLLLSIVEGMSLGSILVGAKYDLYPLLVLLSALLVGYMFADAKKLFFSHKQLMTIFLVIFGVGLLRQVAKYILPGFFEWWGYGAVGDYVLGVNPPLYYRTGPGGISRLQGIFAGPNNYGFFLVGISALVTTLCMRTTYGWRRRLLASLYSVSLLWTLSRGAWISAGVGVIITVVYLVPAYKKYVWYLLGACVVAITGMSIYKSGSTSGHRTALVEGIQAFVQQPWGYGLGMAGPSVHYQGVYLPENQYMQILLDLGVGGFVLWMIVFFGTLGKIWQQKKCLHPYVLWLLFGIIAMCVEGLFLHVREDSMVNYLILGFFGIMGGYALARGNHHT